jgi:ATP-dependent helicase/nuclease subunit B
MPVCLYALEPVCRLGCRSAVTQPRGLARGVGAPARLFVWHDRDYAAAKEGHTLPASFLDAIAAARRHDPLAPATVIVPSHVAGIQLRRRLATQYGAFAGVRFETLPRLAELLGAGDLARAGKSPLARPIGDYLASQIAIEARADLQAVRSLPGFARVLRQTFRRLRRGGFPQPQDVRVPLDNGLIGEVVRLYGIFRHATRAFYDDEDLLEAAAANVERRRDTVARELGDVYVLPPGALSAPSEGLLASIRRAAGRAHYHVVAEEAATAEPRFVLAPDPAGEAREVAREIVDALRGGLGLHEVAVFHGADPAYRALLSQVFAAAAVPVNALPGVPLGETAAGRGVLMLAELPLQSYSRTHVIDWLSLAPLKDRLPGTNGPIPALPAVWRRLAREAGITRGVARWHSGLNALLSDLDARLEQPLDETWRARDEEKRDRLLGLRAVIEILIARMESLRGPQPAAAFIEAFKAVVGDYFDPSAPAFEAVLGQVDQLGTIGSVGGRFNLESFAGALRANLDAAHYREGALGAGVLVSDYRLAAGLSFEHTILCGAYEGVFPAGAPAEPLVEDRIWQDLRKSHSMIEDAALRIERAQAQAARALASGSERVTWTAPLQAANAGREHYPAQMMVAAARSLDAAIDSATALRRASARPWLRRPASPTAALLSGTPLDLTEAQVRSGIVARRDGHPLPVGHPLLLSLRLLASRRAPDFGPYDGNVAELTGDALIPGGSVSPTSLEDYATCGFRYFLGRILRLRPPEEPEDRDTMDAAERGTIVHAVLQEFFERQQQRGRPAPFEPWGEADREDLLQILESHLDAAQEHGKTGLDIYAEHERRRLRADMSNFLEQDTAFRAETSAVPGHFEVDLPPDPLAAIPMRGVVDRIDWTEDRSAAWIIDYKTGSTSAYDAIKDADPLAGGAKLQLPAYLAAAAEADKVTPLYWFISTAGKFTRKPFDASEANMQRYRDTLQAIVAGVRGGVFLAVPGLENTYYGGWDNCRYCDFNRLCSRRRDDEFEVKQHDDAVRPWLGVAEAARGGLP